MSFLKVLTEIKIYLEILIFSLIKKKEFENSKTDFKDK